MATARRRWRGLRRKPARLESGVSQPVEYARDRVVDICVDRVVPPLAEDRLEDGDRRARGPRAGRRATAASVRTPSPSAAPAGRRGARRRRAGCGTGRCRRRTRRRAPAGPDSGRRRASGDGCPSGAPAGRARPGRRQCSTSRSSARFSCALNCMASMCERQTRPRTHTPRLAGVGEQLEPRWARRR